MSEKIIMRTGEALVAGGPPGTAAEPEVVIGALDGPVGTALATLTGDQVKGHSRVFALLNTDIMVRPATLCVSKVTVDDPKYTNILMGTVQAAIANGAAYVGFVFFPKSPRFVTIEQAALLAQAVPPGVAKVALVVNADDALLDQITGQVPLDILQLHGSETPARVTEIRARYGLPVMKAVGVADESDLAALDTYARVADQILVDAKPPKNAELPGGNGLAFDWRLIAGRRWPVACSHRCT